MKKLKKYVSPATASVNIDTEDPLAIVFDPSQTTSMQLTNERDDEIGDETDWGSLW